MRHRPIRRKSSEPVIKYVTPHRGFAIYRKSGFYYCDEWSGVGFFPKKQLTDAIDKHLPPGAVFYSFSPRWGLLIREKSGNICPCGK